MNNNIFSDKNNPPTDAMTAAALGKRVVYWKELKEHVEGSREEWKYYGATIGWQKKLFLGKRNLFFMTVCGGYFSLAFVFGAKGVERVRKSTLPKSLIDELVNARAYAEGRGIRLTIKSRRALEQAKMLTDIKRES